MSGDTTGSNSDDLRPIWGAEAIAAEINRTPRQTFYLLETGAIPAKKVANQWVSNRRALKTATSPEVA